MSCDDDVNSYEHDHGYEHDTITTGKLVRIWLIENYASRFKEMKVGRELQ